jgi:hypothetical protein
MPAFYHFLGRGSSYKRAQEYETGMDYLAHGMSYHGRAVTPRSRLSFFKAFGLTPAA